MTYTVKYLPGQPVTDESAEAYQARISELIGHAAQAEEEIDPDELEEFVAAHRCARCQGSLQFLGLLGNKDWFRCRSCGADECRDHVGEEE